MSVEHFDVLIIGAGLSGIGAAYRLQSMCPGKRYAVLEGREAIGGTWDLFRYPGIRSDSDMYTLGYPFRPWKAAKAIADGADIRNYIVDTAREAGIDKHIRFRQRIESASWSSAEGRWTLRVRAGEQGVPTTYTCGFLYTCCGYYDYENGHMPDFKGAADFKGQFVHPQKWPENLDYAGKQVVVIGSGATAVTLVPSMAPKAAHITMLQRSPSYIASLPARDALAGVFRRVLPEQLAHSVARWKNVLIGLAFYQVCRKAPRFASALLRKGVQRQLPKGYPVDTHFKPYYKPWDQRLCLVPDGDLFRALRSGKASVVTDQIDHFSANAIHLKSGATLPADIVISATGLKLLAGGGIRFDVDGRPVSLGGTMVYRGVLLQGLPNLAMCVGYTNASWTLRADMSSTYICRLLNYMERNGQTVCVPQCDDESVEQRPLLDLTSAYVQRASDVLPKQGSKRPWDLRQNYLIDRANLEFKGVDESSLKFYPAQRLVGLAADLGVKQAA